MTKYYLKKYSSCAMKSNKYNKKGCHKANQKNVKANVR